MYLPAPDPEAAYKKKSAKYRLKSGKVVPSVTTVLYPYHANGVEGLIRWNIEQLSLGTDGETEKRRAALTGTMCHEAVEAYVKGEGYTFNGADQIAHDRALKAFGAFREWADVAKLTVTGTEMSLVSERYEYAGTLDATIIKAVRNVRALGDWKFSKSVRGNYLIQLAAYGQLWNENFPDDPVLGGYYLCRFDPNYGSFDHRWWPELDNQLKQFLHLREVYRHKSETEAKAK